jgi:hypothetical protein
MNITVMSQHYKPFSIKSNEHKQLTQNLNLDNGGGYIYKDETTGKAFRVNVIKGVRTRGNKQLFVSVNYSLNPTRIFRNNLIQKKLYNIFIEKNYLVKDYDNLLLPAALTCEYRLNRLEIIKSSFELCQIYNSIAQGIFVEVYHKICSVIPRYSNLKNVFCLDYLVTMNEIYWDIETENILKAYHTMKTGLSKTCKYCHENFKPDFFIAWNSRNKQYCNKYKIYIKAKNILRMENVISKRSLISKLIFNNARDFYQKLKLYAYSVNSFDIFYRAMLSVI